MNCVDVQQLLSEAVDGERVEPSMLAKAREHCRTCSDCASFVQGLAVVHKAAPPVEPTGLAERVIAAVRDEAARTAALAAGNEGVPGDAEASTEPLASAASRRPGRRWTPVTIGAWVGAAAAVLVLVVFGAVAGVRTIVNGPSSRSTGEMAYESTGEPATAESGKGAPSTAESDAQATGTDEAAQALATPDLIDVNGFAYRLVGPLTVDRSTLTTYSTTTTSLDTQNPPSTYTVYRTSGSGRVALVDDDETLVFELVRRTYDQRSYGLSASSLQSFDAWPMLPSSIPVPTTDTGAPTFVPAGTDGLGVDVYRLPTLPAAQGFAVPPNTPSPDPADGNPNWTWWMPAPS